MPPTESASRQAWVADLNDLRVHAQERFADISWRASDGSILYGHKCICYSRAKGSWQAKYLDTRRHGSSSNLRLEHGPETSELHSMISSTSLGSASPCGEMFNEQTATGRSGKQGLTGTVSKSSDIFLEEGTSSSLFERYLAFLYSGDGADEGVAVLFDGFTSPARQLQGDAQLSTLDRLHEDMLYMWRAQVFADCSLMINGIVDARFPAHRAILSSRTDYFRSLLSNEFGDSHLQHFVLPSPPFTAASLAFILGFIYSGTISFSPQKLDLSTALDVWRGSSFLGIDSLQQDLGKHIQSLLSTQSAARVYAFALASDVRNQCLADAAGEWVFRNIDDVWNTSIIGTMEYGQQKAIVRAVRQSITSDNVVAFAGRLLRLRKRLGIERADWAEHVLSMVDAVEEELVKVLSQQLDTVVSAQLFSQLMDGVGFSMDVLEFTLTLVIKGLSEPTAAKTFQVVLDSILQRQHGIYIDAKSLVEDAKSAILLYLKRRWLNIRTAGGFNILTPSVLQQVAEHIGVDPHDLIIADVPQKMPGSIANHVHRLTSIASKESLNSSRRRDRTGTSGSTRVSNAQTADGNRTSVSGQSAHTAPTPSRAPRPATLSLPPATRRLLTSSSPRVRTSSSPSSSPRSSADKRLESPILSRITPSALAQNQHRSSSALNRQSGSDTTVAIATGRTRSSTSIRSLQVPRDQNSNIQPHAKGIPEKRVNPLIKAELRQDPSIARRTEGRRPLPTPRTAPASNAPCVPSSPSQAATPQQALPRASKSQNLIAEPLTEEQSQPRTGRRDISLEGGTQLLSGIPCIVTACDDKSLCFQATARYIGPLADKSGEWIGVDVSSEVVRPGTPSIISGVNSLDLLPGNIDSTSDMDTPLENDVIEGDKQVRRTRAKSDDLDMGNDGDSAGRLLFVRPDQVLYVL